MYERQIERKQEKLRRLEEQRKLNELKEMMKCTFQPKISSNLSNSLSGISYDYNNKTFSSFRNSYIKPDNSDNDIR